jgi:hypothetical protein
MTTTLRQRPNAKKANKELKKRGSRDKDGKTDAAAKAADAASEKVKADPTAWDTLTSHWSLPFYAITITIGLPFVVKGLYLYLFLKRPDLVAQYTGIQLRPAVSLTESRPLLVVGTMSGGTTQVAHELQKTLGLEVCHENSETTQYFCRDGTVSWFHGLRFLQKSPNAVQHVQSLGLMCTNFTPSMGFHPHMYRATSDCSTRQQWSSCWIRECLELLNDEWGCAWAANSEEITAKECQTPYARSLHQVRHPLRTIESLMAKFCPNNVDVDPGFVQFATAWFPHHDFSSYSCLEATGYYAWEYHTAMRRAVKTGLIQESYRVEETSPCQVATAAGFGPDEEGDDDPLIWDKSRKRAQKGCIEQESSANEPMVSTAYKVNWGSVFLSKADFVGPANATLWTSLESLTMELGYDKM